MWKRSRPSGVLIVLSGILALASFACSSNEDQVSPPSQPAEPVATAPVPSFSAEAPVSPPISEPSQLSSYERAMDTAQSATSISQSAQSPDDWKLVVSRWQEAITFLKAVPASSPYHQLAKNRIPQYQRNLIQAQKQASRLAVSPVPTPVVVIAPKKPSKSAAPSRLNRTQVTSSPTNKEQVFRAPIKRRAGGTPVIDVTFNSSHTFEMILDTGASGTLITEEMATKLRVRPEGEVSADTASAKGVKFPIGTIKSISVNGAQIRNIKVAIAGSDLEIGLLGHDFFGNYDITIKRDVVEFRPQ